MQLYNIKSKNMLKQILEEILVMVRIVTKELIKVSL